MMTQLANPAPKSTRNLRKRRLRTATTRRVMSVVRATPRSESVLGA